MKTFKIVVYAALTVFHVTAIVMISVGRNNFDFLLNLFNKLDWMMYGAYLGLILFLTTILFDYLNKKNMASMNKRHQEEVNELKAKLYDKKETNTEAKPVETPKPSNAEDKSAENDAETRVD